MKREFLQNFKVNDQPLPKEIIDAIMDENGRDIEAAKKPYSDYNTVKSQLEEAQKTITEIQQKSQSLEDAQQEAAKWEQKYNKAVEDHKAELADRDFNQLLESAITGVKGKNVKAITALLDVEKLRNSRNQQADIKAALDSLRAESGYLFDDEGGKAKFTAPGGGNPQPGKKYSMGELMRMKNENPQLDIKQFMNNGGND